MTDNTPTSGSHRPDGDAERLAADTQPRHSAIRELYFTLLDADPAERERVLARQPDRDLAEQVGRLLAHGADDPRSKALEAGLGLTPLVDLAFEQTRAPNRRQAPPERVGPYRIIRRLGAGGMGVVYEAIEDRTERRVAVKLLRPGLVAWTGAAAHARFEQEVRALGRLEHEGITRVLAAGEEQVGGEPLPWFAMDLVEGVELDDWMRGVGHPAPGLTRRLELFVELARAVGHAHERGVAHRDLKPSNVLVDQAGRPRVLDFGIAQIVEGDGPPQHNLTATGSFVGTLAYLAPERLQGRTSSPVDDARADVWSLGVLLWEAIFGHAPLPLADLPPAEAARRLASETLPSPRGLRPLTKLDAPPSNPGAVSGSRTARSSSTRPSPDLALLLETATAADPLRRYPNGNALMADLERYLTHQPLLARRPSAAYRAAKFVRRHRSLALTVAASFALLLVALVVVHDQAQQARESERIALAETARKERVRDFLLLDMLRRVDPWVTGQVEVEDLLSQATSSMQTTFADDPQTLNELRLVLAEAWISLGNSAAARPLLAALEQAPEGSSAGALRELELASRLDLEAGDLAQAGRSLKARAHVMASTGLGPESTDGLLARGAQTLLEGRLATLEGRFADAEARLAEAETSLTHTNSEMAFDASRYRVENLLSWGVYPLAEQVLDSWLERLDAPGPAADRPEAASPRLALPLFERTKLALVRGDTEKARADLQRADSILTTSLGEAHRALAPIRVLEASLAWQSGDAERALELLDELEAHLPSEAEAPLIWAGFLAERGTARQFLDRIDPALEDYNRALELVAGTVGREHPQYAKLLAGRAPILEWSGRLDQAIDDLDRSVAIFGRSVTPLQSEYAEAELTLGSFVLRAGRPEEALAHLDLAIELYSRVRGPWAESTAFARNERAVALQRVGRYTEAIAARRELIEHYAAVEPSLALAIQYTGLGSTLRAAGDLAAARSALEQSVSWHEQLFDEPNPSTSYALEALAKVLAELDELPLAIETLGRAVAESAGSLGAESARTRALETTLVMLEARALGAEPQQ